MRFVIRGREYEITKEEILERMRGVEPKEIRKYYVEVNGREYPIKQVISETLNVEPIAFTSMDAFGILSRLGFDVRSEGWEVCDAEADRRRGYKERGIIILKDKFKVFVGFKEGEYINGPKNNRKNIISIYW